MGARTEGAGAVESLGEAPLRLGELARAARNIIARRVAQHVIQSVGLGDVLALPAENDGELRLVVARVRLLRRLGQRRLGGPRVPEGGARLPFTIHVSATRLGRLQRAKKGKDPKTHKNTVGTSGMSHLASWACLT